METYNTERAKELLEKLLYHAGLVKEIENELDALRYRASGAGAIRYDKDHVMTSPQNYIEIAIQDIADVSRKLDKEKELFEALLYDAYSIIRQMKVPEQRIALVMHYMNCKPWQEVETVLNISKRKMFYIRNEALEEFGRLMK